MNKGSFSLLNKIDSSGILYVIISINVHRWGKIYGNFPYPDFGGDVA